MNSNTAEQITEIIETRPLGELLTDQEVATVVAEKYLPGLDSETNLQAIAKALEKKRVAVGFDIPAFKDFSETDKKNSYLNWDKEKAAEIIAEVESKTSIQETAEVIDIAPPEKIDLDLLEIMPHESRTDSERYSDLIVKAETKAREYRNRLDLKPEEAARLAEIESDIAYFTKKKEAALEKELAEKPIQSVREELVASLSARENPPELIPKNKSAEAPEIKLPEPPPKKPSLASKTWRWLIGQSPTQEEQALTFITEEKPPKKLKPVDPIKKGYNL